MAVGLLAALDPFEQLKKGTDTGIRNTVSEIHGATIRYYAIKTQMPFGSTLDWSSAASGYEDAISPIVTTGELKADFSTLAGEQLENIYMVGTEENITVCFQPTSRSFRNDPNSKFVETGGDIEESADVQTECFDEVTSDDYSCYWCVF